MKCLRNALTGEIKRVTDNEAKHLASYSWRYVPKSTWKRSQGVIGSKPRLYEGLRQPQPIRRV